MYSIKQILIPAFGLLFNVTNAQNVSNPQITIQFDKLLSEQFKSNETGVSVLISKKGEVIYKKAFGMANLELNVPMQVDNVFRIGSITKQFTAVAILQLMEQGRLRLNDNITKYIPDYPTQGNKITIEHLLTHTSGIANKTDMPDYMGRIDLKPTEMIDHFKNVPMKFTPGTNWSYSNNGYFLLGYIIEKITDKTYEEYLEENIFKPLGMTNSLYANDTKIIKNRAGGYTKEENGFENAQPLSMTHPYSAGSIQSTVEDLFKWHKAIHSYKLIKKENLDKAFTRYKLTDGKETSYGYGWRLGYVYENPSIWHGGLINGFITMEIYLPNEDVFVAVFSNCECNSPVDISSRLAALAAGKTFEYKEIPIENSTLQEYVGVYENQKDQQRIITVSQGQLFSQIGRGPTSKLKAYQKDMFFIDEDLTIEFSRNNKNAIEKLITKNLNGNQTWTKTNKPIPDQNGIKVDGKILQTYAGEYEISSDFTFLVTKEHDKLFLQATGQEKLEMFADTETKFFLKVNDAQIEFINDETGKITKVILNQGGRQMEAKKIR
jgi:CubicO group peptidase (beta-lactamase class C family)